VDNRVPALLPVPAATVPPMEARADAVLRALVRGCQQIVEPQGFRLDGRGRFDTASWVRFERPVAADGRVRGREQLLIAHERTERALVADLFAVDTRLGLYTPRRRLVHRYGEAAVWSQTMGPVMAAVESWCTPAARPAAP
jgi:hypothetical protein